MIDDDEMAPLLRHERAITVIKEKDTVRRWEHRCSSDFSHHSVVRILLADPFVCYQ